VRLEGQKQREMSMSIPVIEQAKIQAQVLVPLIKAMQAELGEARANALVRKALGEIYRRYGEEFWRAKREENLGNSLASAFAQFARGDAIDYRVREQSLTLTISMLPAAATRNFIRSWASQISVPLGLQRGFLDGGGFWSRHKTDAHANHHARR
jgi:hypothetical protein